MRYRTQPPFPNVDHDVRAASRPVMADARVRVPLINPTLFMQNQHDHFDRQVIAAVREIRALYEKRFTIRPLEIPYQKGWERFYRLTERASDREDRATLEEILKVIGSTTFHHSRVFRRRERRSRKVCEIEQPLKAISVNAWGWKRYPDSWLRYFSYELRLESNNHHQPYRVFAQPSLFELKIGRHWISHIREIDPDIESRIAEQERWLELQGGWHHYHHLRGRRNSWRELRGSEKQRSLDKAHRSEIANAKLIFPEIGPAASARCAPASFRKFPLTNPKLRQRSIRLVPGRAGRKSLRVHPLSHENKHRCRQPALFSNHSQ